MEEAIAIAEVDIERAEAIANDENVISNHQEHAKACADVAAAHEVVRVLYERWAELEAMQP